MICFPLDNTDYEANALGAWCGTRTRGVYSADGHYAVTANDDMTVTVSPGLAWLKAGDYWGVNIYESNPTVLTVDTADGSLSRIDAVCVRLDKNQNRGEIVIKKGSYSLQSPVITLPAHNLDYDEIYVATIAVPKGATAIKQADITDQRLNENYCGVMRDGVTAIPTQQLYDAWWAWFSNLQIDNEQRAAAFTAWLSTFRQENETALAEWLTDFKANSQAAFDLWFAAFKRSNITAYNSWYDAFKSNSENSFGTWFQNLQNQLNENQAANLQSQINQHEAMQVTSKDGVHGIRHLNGELQIRIADRWVIVDTKNTAGSSNSTSKVYLVGAETQTSHGTQTYSNSNVYMQSGKLYSNGEVVATEASVAQGVGPRANLSIPATTYKVCQIGSTRHIWCELTDSNCMQNGSDAKTSLDLYLHGLGLDFGLKSEKCPVGRAKIVWYASSPAGSPSAIAAGEKIVDVLVSALKGELVANMSGFSIPASYYYTIQLYIAVPL